MDLKFHNPKSTIYAKQHSARSKCCFLKQYVTYSQKIFILIICRLPSRKKYIYDWNITLNYCLSTKSVPGVILSGNAMVASNTQVSLELENCKWLKSYVNTVPMITSFKILKYFSCGKTSFFRFASLW